MGKFARAAIAQGLAGPWSAGGEQMHCASLVFLGFLYFIFFLAQAAQRGAGGSSLGISSSRLDVGLGPLLGVALLEQGWHHRDPSPPSTW